jgi:hypothetical protein
VRRELGVSPAGFKLEVDTNELVSTLKRLIRTPGTRRRPEGGIAKLSYSGGTLTITMPHTIGTIQAAGQWNGDVWFATEFVSMLSDLHPSASASIIAINGESLSIAGLTTPIHTITTYKPATKVASDVRSDSASSERFALNVDSSELMSALQRLLQVKGAKRLGQLRLSYSEGDLCLSVWKFTTRAAAIGSWQGTISVSISHLAEIWNRLPPGDTIKVIYLSRSLILGNKKIPAKREPA